jgi:3-deoxy-7-phosphoheptulonate synthase
MMVAIETGARDAGRKPDEWRRCRAERQPVWPDEDALARALARVGELPPLVFAGEAQELRARLAAVAEGRAFLLQVGDCAESFRDFSAANIENKLRVILQMAAVLTYGGGVPVVKVGRIAGQFAKPRSSAVERHGTVELPSFGGHAVNDDPFTPEARRPDPERLLSAYYQSAATLNLLRALTKGGFADISRVHQWNRTFVASSGSGRRYAVIAAEIGRAIDFMQACGVDVGGDPQLRQVDLYTSHEALLLGYEDALTHQDARTGGWYGCSAHMLWVGDRTRQPSGAHVAYLAGIGNPIGCKVGPSTSPEELLELCAILDPERRAGRLTLIARMGARRVAESLPPLVRAVRDAGYPVVWACDPMHGNTYEGASGRKTRRFDDVMAEIEEFFTVQRAEGAWPGGIHIEMTGDDVTECLGGSDAISDDRLGANYTTICDPRLNGRQSLDLAFRVAELLRAQ